MLRGSWALQAWTPKDPLCDGESLACQLVMAKGTLCLWTQVCMTKRLKVTSWDEYVLTNVQGVHLNPWSATSLFIEFIADWLFYQMMALALMTVLLFKLYWLMQTLDRIFWKMLHISLGANNLDHNCILFRVVQHVIWRIMWIQFKCFLSKAIVFWRIQKPTISRLF